MNLHEMLPLERPVLFFDCETTGPNPSEARIVQLAFARVHPDGSVKEWASLINPGVPIPREATFGLDDFPGHGITDAMVQGCKDCFDAGFPAVTADIHEIHAHVRGTPHEFRPYPTFGQLAANLLIGFSNTDFGGFNVKRYDLPLMVAEFARNGHVWDPSPGRVLDGFRIWQLGSKRSLSDAVQLFLGRPHTDAHSAIDDVRASLQVVVAQLGVFDSLPRDIKALHEQCWPQDPNAIDPDGKIVWKDGEAVMNFGKKWTGIPLARMPRKDLEWIVSPKCQGASAAVKRICSEAIEGRYPVPMKEIAE